MFESLCCDRINSFLTKHKIIHENQFGFQKNSSALSAAASLVDMLQRNLDSISSRTACCVFIDLKKAFDTVPHELLLDTLDNYGIRGNANKLLSEYLTDRKQYVDINGKTSDELSNENRFALPQGSNLGPLLFILYINGIFNLKLKGTLMLFADDAVLVYFDNDIQMLKDNIQHDLNIIANWLSRKKLTLNAEKTKFMLIKPGVSVEPMNTDFSLFIDNKQISRVPSFKYLGITLQENLKWDLHIDSICRKIMGISCVVKRLGGQINNTTKIALYYAMVNSHLTYVSPVWSTSATNNNVNRLQIVQNQAIRSIFYSEYNHHCMSTTDIRKKYAILNVRQIMRLNEMLMYFKLKKNKFKCNFKINTDSAHRYSTRNVSLPRTSTFRTNLGKNSIFRSCTKNFNEMQLNNNNELSINAFKKKIKTELLEMNE